MTEDKYVTNAESTSVYSGMEIQEDVLKLRIENEQLKEQNTNLQIMLEAEREVRCNEEYLKHVTELEEILERAKEIIDKYYRFYEPKSNVLLDEKYVKEEAEAILEELAEN